MKSRPFYVLTTPISTLFFQKTPFNATDAVFFASIQVTTNEVGQYSTPNALSAMESKKLLFFLLLALFSTGSIAHDRLKLEYVQNNGQWNNNVLYRAAFGGGAIYLEDNCISYSFCNPEDRASVHDYSQWSREQQEAFTIRGHAWKMNFVGAQLSEVAGEKIQSHYYNYFLGDDPSKWASNVGIYEAVRYSELYDGIDLRCYNRGANFKYDFIVSPGANENDIRLSFDGLDQIDLRDGALVLGTSIGEFMEAAPYAYQLINNKLKEVKCEYKIIDGEIGFSFAEGYDPSYALIIDPELIAATLSGTVGQDNYGHTSTFDLTGDIYTGAISFGVGYPTTPGAFQAAFNNGGGWGTDIAVSHLSADGTELIWASYLGGGEGDYPHSIVCSSQQELYVYGSTTAADFPTTAGAYDESHNGMADITLSKFSVDGTSLIGSTFLGGSMDDGRNAMAVNYGDTYRGEIILDQSEKPVLASFSSSDDYPTSAGAYQSALSGSQDAIIVRFNTLLTNVEASSFIGSSENDAGYGVRTTNSGNLVVVGTAGAGDFPISAGAYQTNFLGGGGLWDDSEYDGFVTVLNSSASSMIASTYFGTDVQDQIFFVDLDSDENIFVYGQGGTDIPIVGDVYNNPDSRQFISKLSTDLTTLMLSTQIGAGGGDDVGFDFVPIAFLVDHCDNIYISSHGAGWANLPLTPDALYGNEEGGFYLAVLNENMENLEFGTMYTGDHVDGGTSRFDKNGTVYQAVCSGGGFGTTADAWATGQSTGWDIGVFKIDFDVSGVNSAISANSLVGCAPYEIVFDNFSVGDQYLWDFGDGTTSTEEEPVHVYNEPGLYNVSLIVSDSLSCNLADTSNFEVQISQPQDIFPDFTWQIDCATMGIMCTNETGIEYFDYLWDMGDGTILDEYDVDYNYSEPGTYTVSLQAIDAGCEADELIEYEITIFDEVIAVIGNANGEGCAPLEIDFSNGGSGQEFIWDFGDGTPPVSGANVSHIYVDAGNFTVTLMAFGGSGCEGESSTEMEVVVTPAPIVIPEFEAFQVDDCELKTIQINNISTGDGVTGFWDMGDGTTFEILPDTYVYDEPGTYTIVLILTEPICNQQFEYELEVSVIDYIDIDLPPDVSLCPLEEGAILVGPDADGEAVYAWSTGEDTQSIFVTEPGEYGLTVTTNNCTGVGVIEVNVIPEWKQILPMTACENTHTIIEIPYSSNTYEWCDGQSSQTIDVNEPGDYCFMFVDNQGCLQEGVIELTHIAHDATLYIPNAFTPNNDGVNDYFVPVGDDTRYFRFSVFNRWGEVVFDSEDSNQVWDGSFQGSDHYVPNGLYTYSLVYASACSAEKVVKKGYITVIR
ncbi:MAG: gliding motility-associated-like protein [Flavobacteriales bacterium]|jgi:gliding motility-associated-like protein